MRVGVFGFASVVLLICFIILNTGDFEPEMVDTMFEDVAYKGFLDPDLNFSSDANLSKAIKLIGSGMVKEFHGTYYLASWVNTILPEWLFENKELFVYAAIVVFCAPLIAVVLNYAILCFLALCLIVWSRFKVWKKNKKLIKQREVN